MIVVDSSVWINNLRGIHSPSIPKFLAAQERREILLGDLVFLEVLQGARSAQNALRLERMLRAYPMIQLFDHTLASQCASNYRQLRTRGITVRKTIDVIIGTYCILHGHTLLHDDGDFDPMIEYLGLKVL